MLERLRIRNFVLIDRLDAEFGAGFCALTGETGAGKSVVVGALGLLCGARISGKPVKPGAARAELEAVFAGDFSAWLEENGLPAEDEVVVARRLINADGKSRAFINGAAATIAQLAAFGAQAADICGQHAHYSLLSANSRRALLDSFANAAPLVEKAAQTFAQRNEAEKKLRAAKEEGEQRRAARERLKSEIDELESLDFSEQRWRDDNAVINRLAAAAELRELCAQTLAAMDGDNGAAAAVNNLARGFARFENDEEMRRINEMCNDAEALFGELRRALSRFADGLDADPAALAAAEDFVAAAQQAARRFQLSDAAQLESFLQKKKQEAAALEEAADEKQLAANFAAAQRAQKTACAALTRARRAAAAKMQKSANDTLAKLAMAQARFEVKLSPLPAPGAHGAERVDFLVATQKGRAPAPLNEVASGGELSRIGLALQLAARGGGGAMVFDEVDAGIGGATAKTLGRLMRQLGAQRQTLCVSHLAQVAAHAHHHYHIAAKDGGISLNRLEGDARLAEIARLAGGEDNTAARAHAAGMLQKAAAA